ncbi:hypothetical protein ACIBXA_31765 [Micromonospora echinaurantiaca]|uniref:hypothetical protein n=1 Tax=Micromonospora echinaurantiaca TaxID=47857 RepID=UPI00379AAE09
MPERPTVGWRHHLEEQRAQLRAGTLRECEGWALEAYTDSFIAAADSALATFEQMLAQVDPQSDPAVLGAVQQVVLALNDINTNHNDASFDTDEREQLCEYIDEALVGAGIDTEALAARHGLKRWEITDRWRDW